MIIGLTIYSEHVMQVEHVLTIASVLTVVGVGARYVLHCHFTLFHVKFVAFLATFLLKLKKKMKEIFKRGGNLQKILSCTLYVRDFYPLKSVRCSRLQTFRMRQTVAARSHEVRQGD